MIKALLHLVWEIFTYPLAILAVLILAIVIVVFGMIVLAGMAMCWWARRIAPRRA